MPPQVRARDDRGPAAQADGGERTEGLGASKLPLRNSLHAPIELRCSGLRSLLSARCLVRFQRPLLNLPGKHICQTSGQGPDEKR